MSNPGEWRIYDAENDRTHTDRGLVPGDQRNPAPPCRCVDEACGCNADAAGSDGLCGYCRSRFHLAWHEDQAAAPDAAGWLRGIDRVMGQIPRTGHSHEDYAHGWTTDPDDLAAAADQLEDLGFTGLAGVVRRGPTGLSSEAIRGLTGREPEPGPDAARCPEILPARPGPVMALITGPRPCWSCRWGPRRWTGRYHPEHGRRRPALRPDHS